MALEIKNRYSFGHDNKTANELAILVAFGVKKATCWRYIEGESLPELGELSVIQNAKQEDVCIVETTAVEIKSYNQVDEEFAELEGEGDKSLEYWRQAHKDFFTKEGFFEEEMQLVCEQFKLISLLKF